MEQFLGDQEISATEVQGFVREVGCTRRASTDVEALNPKDFDVENVSSSGL